LEQWKIENNWDDLEPLADETDVMKEVQENGVSPQGSSIPWSEWNLASKGNPPVLSGSFNNYGTLYSNYNYTGLKKYKFELKNTSNTPLSYQWKDLVFNYAIGSLSGNTTKTGTISVSYTDISFYLRVAPGNNNVVAGSISGTIKK
jgi:hypothetical protein